MYTKTVLLLPLAFAICCAAICQGQETADPANPKADKATARTIKATTTRMMKKFEPAKLTESQKEEVKAIVEEQVPRILAARKSNRALLTAEQRQARKKALAELKEQGVKGNQRTQGGIDAMGLSEDKMIEFQSTSKKIAAATRKIPQAITAILSKEQAAAMPNRRSGSESEFTVEVNLTQTVALKLPGMT